MPRANQPEQFPPTEGPRTALRQRIPNAKTDISALFRCPAPSGTVYASSEGMKRQRIKIPTPNSRNLIPAALHVQVFTEQAEAALSRSLPNRTADHRSLPATATLY